jgi:hypothetical protein
MRIKLFLITILSLTTIEITAQADSNKTTYWISLSSENDFLGVGKTSDQYYTFGEKLDFLKRLTSSESNDRYLNFSLKLEGHTPKPALFPNPNEIRRPFFGWVFGNFSMLRSGSKSYLKYGIDIGMSGPSSRAGFYQNWYHENIFLDNKAVLGWENQTPDKLGINLRIDYKRLLYQQNNSYLRTGVNASIGNIFTYFSPTLNYRWIKNKHQAFLPYRYKGFKSQGLIIEAEVALNYELQNAAMSGEYFSNEGQYLSKENIFPFVFIAKVGASYSFTKLTLFANNSINSIRVKGNEVHHFGQIGVSYSF